MVLISEVSGAHALIRERPRLSPHHINLVLSGKRERERERRREGEKERGREIELQTG